MEKARKRTVACIHVVTGHSETLSLPIKRTSVHCGYDQSMTEYKNNRTDGTPSVLLFLLSPYKLDLPAGHELSDDPASVLTGIESALQPFCCRYAARHRQS